MLLPGGGRVGKANKRWEVIENRESKERERICESNFRYN